MLEKLTRDAISSRESACISVSLFDMLSSLSAALALIDYELIDHHNRVCYIATKLATHLRFSADEINDIYMAASMHDIGAIAFLNQQDREKLNDFDIKNAHLHGELGSLILSRFEPFRSFSALVRFHHVPWEFGEGKYYCGEKVSYGSHILHMADRISVLLDRGAPVFSQVSSINARVKGESGRMFVPAFVDAFLELSRVEAFWLDLISPSMDRILQNISCLPNTSLSFEHLTDWSQFFALIIDTRSRFTATHSGGVAASAMGLGAVLGMNTSDCQKISLAGYLHDLGKLAVPESILLKPGKPSEEEWQIIRAHSYYTHRILERIEGLEDITFWASNHHEELGGGGYPFAMTADNLSLGARTMAVADIFTALAEDRPYRAGMKKENSRKVFQDMVRAGKLDKQVVDALYDNYETINEGRIVAQKKELKNLSNFWVFFGEQVNES
jgi:HD-GYP domain-containing protein (c-di-GMP phosphodiesterase class II)